MCLLTPQTHFHAFVISCNLISEADLFLYHSYIYFWLKRDDFLQQSNFRNTFSLKMSLFNNFLVMILMASSYVLE